MSRTIVVASGKGGVGKTSVTANLGACLARLGMRVVVMDVDIGLNNLDVVMGIENKVVYDLVDVIEGRCRPKQALIQDALIPSLYVMPSAHSYERSKVDGAQIKSVVDGLAQIFDYVLIDCPAGIELGFHRAVQAVDEALVVTTPHISSIRDADKVLSILKGYKLLSTGVIVNRVRGDLVVGGEMMGVTEISTLLREEPVGVIPDDDSVSLYSSMGKVLFKDSPSLTAFKCLANNIHNGQKVLYDPTIKYRGIFGSIRKNLKKRV